MSIYRYESVEGPSSALSIYPKEASAIYIVHYLGWLTQRACWRALRFDCQKFLSSPNCNFAPRLHSSLPLKNFRPAEASYTLFETYLYKTCRHTITSALCFFIFDTRSITVESPVHLSSKISANSMRSPPTTLATISVQQYDEEVQGSEGPQKGAEGEDSIQVGTGFRALAVAVAPYISDIESDASPVMNVAIGDEDAQTTVARARRSIADGFTFSCHNELVDVQAFIDPAIASCAVEKVIATRSKVQKCVRSLIFTCPGEPIVYYTSTDPAVFSCKIKQQMDFKGDIDAVSGDPPHSPELEASLSFGFEKVMANLGADGRVPTPSFV
jgi:hypothetical protein